MSLRTQIARAALAAVLALSSTHASPAAAQRAPRRNTAPTAPAPRRSLDFEDEPLALLTRAAPTAITAVDAVQIELTRNAPALYACGLAGRDPSATSPRAVTVRFRVEPDGTVRDASLEGSTPDALASCVLAAVRALRVDLGASPQPVRVTATWSFSS